MININSQKDLLIKLIRDLQKESERLKNSLYFSEGFELVKRAFLFQCLPESILLTDKFAHSNQAAEIISLAKQNNVSLYSCSEGLLGKILDSKPTPECIAVLARKTIKLDEALQRDCQLIMMVENCENQDNLGMLLRTTDAAGMSSVVLTAETVDPFSRKVVRGSRGAVYSTPICIHKNAPECIDLAKSKGVQVIATSANTQKLYTSIDYTKPIMIIVGNEHVGISNEVRSLSDEVVKIPMLGKINSLNIAVAASIVMYEAVRQRTK